MGPTYLSCNLQCTQQTPVRLVQCFSKQDFGAVAVDVAQRRISKRGRQRRASRSQRLLPELGPRLMQRDNDVMIPLYM